MWFAKPDFPIRIPGAEGRCPDLLLRIWEEGRNLYNVVVGSSSLASSNVEVFAPGPGGAALRAVARNSSFQRRRPTVRFSVLRPRLWHTRHLPLRLWEGWYACDGSHARCGQLGRFIYFAHEDRVWYSVVRRLSMHG
jgi:hypothetical protein